MPTNRRINLIIRGILLAGLLVAALPAMGFLVYLAAAFFEGHQNKDHQPFAANSFGQIAPAHEMDQLYSDCRHFITYDAGRYPLLNSVAYFDDRYVLTMQVPVDIQSPTAGSMVGSPRFYLDEVDRVTVSSTGQVGASYSRNLEFDYAQWTTVYNAGGDYSRIGFQVKTTPVPQFSDFADASR